MRSSFAAVLLASLVGCVGVVDSPTGGNTPPGDDTGGDDQPPAPTPKLDSSIDKTTFATELGTTQEMKITLTGSGTFAGPVTITPTLADGPTPITDWDLQLDQTSVTLATNGTATVTATLKIPTDAAELSGKVSFAISSSLGAQPVLENTVTVTKQVTLVVTENNNGQCVYPGGTTTVRSGTKVRFLNMSTDTGMIIHGSGKIPHQDTNTSLNTNQAYEVTLNGTGSGSWYCHSPGPNQDQQVNVVQ